VAGERATVFHAVTGTSPLYAPREEVGRGSNSLASALLKWREGSAMWEAIVVDLQSQKSKPERIELRTLQLINEIRPKLLKQGLLLIGVWTNSQMT
jgi:hypothetical protein